ncbi:FxLYD domain-containing protein [Microbacterium terricola]|uniref:DUF4190 domain-containing protein n=1 Tax=Microbacterium terricola TaxID=344163 RepID=A0ABM8E2Q8_9MICO|nr:FxLYD domain-containing protein [Microbacterium terricola]UYK40286.1 FxLYD domain-containing protein [Microbacterium terricola]BDV32001.1 hypothetical protein Microterr_26610 [Microbacterium terricola]
MSYDTVTNPAPPPAPLGATGPATPEQAVKKPRNVLGRVALVVAIIGMIFACIPGALIIGWILLPIAFVLGIVSLFRTGKGKSAGLTGLILSIVGTVIGASVFASLAVDAVDDAFSGSEAVAVAPADSGAVDVPAESAAAAAAAVDDIQIVESGFGAESSGSYWYGVVIDNPNSDYVFTSEPVTVEAVAEDGTILDSATSYVTLLQGQTILTGTFFSVGSSTIDHLDVRGPGADDATSSPANETGVMTVSDIKASTDYGMTTVSGTVSSTLGEDQELVSVEIIARDDSGTMVGSTTAFIDRLPTEGAAQFEGLFLDLPADVTFEATAVL